MCKAYKILYVICIVGDYGRDINVMCKVGKIFKLKVYFLWNVSDCKVLKIRTNIQKKNDFFQSVYSPGANLIKLIVYCTKEKLKTNGIHKLKLNDILLLYYT